MPTRVRSVALALLTALLPQFVNAQATTGTVRGRVTEAVSGRGIGNVQVTIVGTRLGTSTGDDGAFTIAAVPTGARSVSARRIGYQPATKLINVNAGDNAAGDIALSESAVNLSEVVVTGTAAPTEKRKLGTSVAAVDSTLISRAQAVTVDQAMQGKIPGAQITQN